MAFGYELMNLFIILIWLCYFYLVVFDKFIFGCWYLQFLDIILFFVGYIVVTRAFYTVTIYIES